VPEGVGVGHGRGVSPPSRSNKGAAPWASSEAQAREVNPAEPHSGPRPGGGRAPSQFRRLNCWFSTPSQPRAPPTAGPDAHQGAAVLRLREERRAAGDPLDQRSAEAREITATALRRLTCAGCTRAHPPLRLPRGASATTPTRFVVIAGKPIQTTDPTQHPPKAITIQAPQLTLVLIHACINTALY
jgi:hypothetical protein